MGAVGNDPDFRFHSPYAQQKYHNISCFWEKQPRGCLRISCAFHHSKPRHINGLFLPPTNNAPLQQAMQEEILPPAPQQESRRHQQHIPLPIHPPLIINLGDEEDDEDDEEENYVPNWVPKTDADIEEERAIKEICYKSGEYYRIQPPREHQSTNTESSPREKELSPSEATNRDLQKGKTDHRAFENGDAPLQQAIQEEILPPAPQQESRRHQQHIPLPIHPPLIINLGDEEDDEDDEEENYVPNWVPKTDADIEEERAIKEICYKSGEYYRIQPPREHQSTNTESSPREKELSPSEATNRDLQKGNNVVSIPHQAVQALLRGYLLHPKTVPKEGETSPFPRGIHTSNPRVKPSSQQRGQRKGDETDSSPLCVCTQTGRKSSFRPPEPRRKAYVVYRSVTAKQEPKFSEATAVPEPHGPRGPKQNNQLNTKTRLGTQMQNYGNTYTQISSGSSNSPTWRKRKPHGKTCSHFKTTVQVGNCWTQSPLASKSTSSLPTCVSDPPVGPAVTLQSQSLSAVFCNGFKLRKKGAVGLLCFLMANSGERNNNFYSKIAK
ncbi:unnamed protein product [Bubo scandiacus]